METFDLVIEEKVSTWKTESVRVEAESIEEAIDKCINGEYEIISSEIPWDEIEHIQQSPTEPITVKVYSEGDIRDLVFTNDIRLKQDDLLDSIFGKMYI